MKKSVSAKVHCDLLGWNAWIHTATLRPAPTAQTFVLLALPALKLMNPAEQQCLTNDINSTARGHGIT